MALRKIVMLDTTTTQSGCLEVGYVLWLATPPTQVAVKALAKDVQAESACPTATAEELAALAAGTITEVTGLASYTPGTKFAPVGNDLEKRYAAAQAELNRSVRRQWFGSSWDGTTWTKGGA